MKCTSFLCESRFRDPFLCDLARRLNFLVALASRLDEAARFLEELRQALEARPGDRAGASVR